MDISGIASIDFETCSYADLKKTGAAVYAEDPTTQVICLSWQLPDMPHPLHWFPSCEWVPQALFDWVEAGKPVSGWNVLFEFYIWNVVLRRLFSRFSYPTLADNGIGHTTFNPTNFPKLRLAQLIDTMAVAAYNGLPLSLDQAGQALPHLGVVKDKAGHALMLRMSRPRDKKAGTWWHKTDVAKFLALCDYCDQDVKTERAILGDLIEPPGRERNIWLMDAQASVRGMKLDKTLTDAILTVAAKKVGELDVAMQKVTDGEVSSTRAVTQLLDWAQMIEPKITSLAKDQLSKWIDKLGSERENRGYCRDRWALHEALEIRQEAAKSSVAKAFAMEQFANAADDRMRGLYQYYGAFRTGRDAGRGPQIQNFPRGSVKDQELLIQVIRQAALAGDLSGFELFLGVPVMEALSSALRGCVTVPEGKWFCSYDFAQIEARVTPWLAGDTKKLDVFRQGRDVYKQAASGIYGVPEDAVDGDQRQIGKVSELALGFGGGVGAFQSMAAIYGLEISDDAADQIKVDWRAANKKTVSLWYDLDKAALRVLKGHQSNSKVGFLTFQMRGPNLHMTLPSGRDLIYRDAKLGTNKFGSECVTYMGVNQYTRKWERIDTYGGKWCENATQAVARDVMKSAALRIALLEGVDLLGPVHDELLLELDDPELEQYVAHEMNRDVAWAPGLPIAADGYIGKRFRK